MELLFILPIIGMLGIYAAYRDWLNVAYRQWLSELDIFKKRLAAYEQLTKAVERVRTNDEVSSDDIDRFDQAMSDMRFLFDQDLELSVSGIFNALLKKHTLDALIAQAVCQKKTPTDQALIELAMSRSRELATHITNGIRRDMPARMEKFMRPRPLISPAAPSSASLKSSLDRWSIWTAVPAGALHERRNETRFLGHTQGKTNTAHQMRR